MGAIISPSGQYRYRLWRQLTPGKRRCLFIMLNPSTATADVDDPTIRRCMGFTRRLSCDTLDVVNLFAYRATDPNELKLHSREHLCGPLNLQHIHQAIGTAEVIIAGWGARGGLHGMDKYVLSTITAPVYCLGKTMHGKPRHPLYLPGDQPLELLKLC